MGTALKQLYPLEGKSARPCSQTGPDSSHPNQQKSVGSHITTACSSHSDFDWFCVDWIGIIVLLDGFFQYVGICICIYIV